MKLIAITQRVDYIESYGERRDSVDQRWAHLVFSCGFIPLMIPNNLEAVKLLLSQVPVDGIILTGGNSLVKYGGDAPERDSTEAYLIEYSIDNNLPLLGVCRGMQVIQDYFGVPLEKVWGHVAVTHEITLQGEKKMKNSYHSYGSKCSTEELRIEAMAKDGVVEAIQHRKYKIHAMMWHPERYNSFEKEDLEFINHYFNE